MNEVYLTRYLSQQTSCWFRLFETKILVDIEIIRDYSRFESSKDYPKNFSFL